MITLLKKITHKIKTLVKIPYKINNFWIYFPDYLRLLKRKYITYELRDGCKFKVRVGTFDRIAINEIWINEMYTPTGFEIKHGDIVIDIGAHIGLFSIFAERKGAKNIYSFEPNEENFNLLKENLMLNNSQCVIPHNLAINDKEGSAKMYIWENHSGKHSLFNKSYNNTKNYEIVRMTTLEKIIHTYKISHVDFLKMDCEGAEYNILFSLSKKTLNKIKKIAMEFHNKNERENGYTIKKFLEKNGFEVIIKDFGYATSGMLFAKKL